MTTVYLVWLRNMLGKVELQVWWYNPSKRLRKKPNIVKQLEVSAGVAEKLTIDELDMIYGNRT